MRNKFMLIFGAALLALIVFSATATAQTSVVNCHCESLENLVEQIVSVGGSLNYVSETDAEVVAFYRNSPVSEVSVSEFKRVLRLDPKKTVYVESAKDFFARVLITDPKGNWLALIDIFESLEDATVFKIPRPRPFQSNFDYFVIGRFMGGQLVGIQTFSIET